MSTAALVSVEDYLRMTEKPNREYRDGVVIPKPMGTKKHGVLQIVLGAMLRSQGLEAVSELRVRVAERTYLLPDVAAAPHIADPYPTEPLLLCVEILSLDDRLGPTFAKCEDYHAWGVPYCWVIDPEKRTVWEYPASGEPVRVMDALRADNVAIDLAELFSALD